MLVSFQVDVCYLPNIQNFKYALLVVDLFSNYIYVKPLKNKSAESVRNSLDAIISENRLFKAKLVLHKRSGIIHYYENLFQHFWVRQRQRVRRERELLQEEEHQVVLFERASQSSPGRRYFFILPEKIIINCFILGYIRIFKQVLYKAIRASKGRPWTQLYQDVVDHINRRPLRKFGGKKSAADLNNPFKDEESKELIEANKKEEKPIKEDILKIGTLVFIDLPNEDDLRSYDLQRGEIKKVKNVDTSKAPYLYTLEDLNGEKVLERRYYLGELKEVFKVRNIPKEIRKIYKSRRKNKRKEYLVSYYNREGKHWIPERILYAF